MLNPRHKRFADLYNRYGNATNAYGEAGEIDKCESGNYPGWCAVEGNRLLRNPKIREYLLELRGEAVALSTMETAEVLDYLVSVITTPVGEIGPESPLCEEYTVHRKPGREDEEPVDVVKIKCVSKIGALKELIRLTGMAAPKKLEVTADSEVKEMLRRLTGAKGEE